MLEELRRAQGAYATAAERLKVARERMARTRMDAPQDGVVNGLRFTTVGGVIPPGGVVLDITPSSDDLVVEARLSPDDIDVMHKGLPARVRLTAYKARRYFSLKGTVTQISPDTFKDDKGSRPFYKVRIEVPETETQLLDRTKLAPGMLAQVEIVTGERTAFVFCSTRWWTACTGR